MTVQETGIDETANLLRLHVGCGRRYLKDYINVDVFDSISSDLMAFDNCKLDLSYDFLLCSSDDIPVPDESVCEILCEHMLEHLTPEQIYETLWEFGRVTAPGGVVKITVPNFEYFVQKFKEYREDYLKSIDVMYSILCNVRNQDRMSPHRSLLWADFLVPLIERVGFNIEKVRKSTDQLFVQAKRTNTRIVRVYDKGGTYDN